MKPATPFEGNSVYSKSYFPPGEYVQVGDGASMEGGDSSDIMFCSDCESLSA
jgi:hypothetical protein